MIRLHPLELRADGPDRYVFRFGRHDGDVQYSFEMKSSPMRAIHKSDDAFFFDTEGDPASFLIHWCVLYFDEARQAKVVLGNKTNLEPVALEYEGEVEKNSFGYQVDFMGQDGSFKKTIVVRYGDFKDSTATIDWDYGSSKVKFESDVLKIQEPIPPNADLLTAVLMFDEARYYRLDPSIEPMRI